MKIDQGHEDPSAEGQDPSVNEAEKCRRDRLLNYWTREVDRSLNIARYTGISIWATFVLLLTSVAYIYNQLLSHPEPRHAVRDILLILWTASSIIFTAFWFRSSWDVLFNCKSPVYLACWTSNLRAYVQKKLLYFAYSLFMLLTAVYCLVYWNSMHSTWLMFVFVGYVSLTLILSIYYFESRQRQLRWIGSTEPDYTLFLSANRKLRTIAGIVTVSLTFLAASALAIFWFDNSDLYASTDYLTLVPPVAAIILMMYVFNLFTVLRAELRLADKHRVKEFGLIRHDFSAEEIADFIEKTMIEKELNEWIEHRLMGLFQKTELFQRYSNDVLGKLRLIVQAKSPDPSRVSQVYFEASDFRRISFVPYLQFLHVTAFHAALLKSADGLSERGSQQLTALRAWTESAMSEANVIEREYNELIRSFLNLTSDAIPT